MLDKQITDFSNTELIQLAGVADIFMNYGLKNIKLDQGKSFYYFVRVSKAHNGSQETDLIIFITAQQLIQSTELVMIDLICVCLMPKEQACIQIGVLFSKLLFFG